MAHIEFDKVRQELDFLERDLRFLRSSKTYVLGELIVALMTPPRGWRDVPGKAKMLFTNRKIHRLSKAGVEVESSTKLVPGMYTIRGRVQYSANERSRIGLARIDFPATELTRSQLKDICGAFSSEEVGLFKYIEPDHNGDFALDFAIGPDCGPAAFSVCSWENRYPVYLLSCELVASPPLDRELEIVPPTQRVALYGDLDMNIIDGSSVWLASMAEVLSRIDGLQVDVYLKRKPTRDALLKDLRKNDNLHLIYDDRELSPSRVVHEIGHQHKLYRYEAVIVRGLRATSVFQLSGYFDGVLCPYLTDLPQEGEPKDDSKMQSLTTALLAPKVLLCQTQAIEDYLRPLAGAEVATIMTPPMVPEVPISGEPKDPRKFKIAFAGKFAKLWATEEMLKVCDGVARDHPNAEMHVFGDKIHYEKSDPKFQQRVNEKLANTPSIFWYGALPRRDVMKYLQSMDVAWAWRSARLEENTRELSTKILEYGSAGLPTILYPNSINVKLLGEDYPLFARTLVDAERLLRALVEANSAQLLFCASDAMKRMASPYSFAQASASLESTLKLGSAYAL